MDFLHPISVSSSSYLLASLSLILISVYLQLHIWSNKNNKKNYGPSPLRLPVIGHMYLMAPYHDNPWEGFCALRRKFGDFISLKMGSRNMILISNMDLIKEVLLVKGEQFVDRPDFSRYPVIFGGDRENALALCDWSQKQRMRRFVAQMVLIPRFGSGMYHQLNACIMTHMQEQMDLMKDVTTLCKRDVLFSCGNIFSHYLCSKRFQHGDAAFHKAVWAFDFILYDINQTYVFDFIPWTQKTGIFSSYFKQLTTICTDVRNEMEELIITPRLQHYLKDKGMDPNFHPKETSPPSDPDPESNHDIFNPKSVDKDMTGKDFLDVSLEHHFLQPEKYSWNVAVFEVLDLIGGHSAVGNLIYKTLGYLAMHPEHQETIYQEGMAATRRTNESLVNLDHRPNMPFTESAVMETLRMASSPIVPHVSVQDTTLGEYDVDKGTMILFNGYHLNMSDVLWEKPKSYNPWRFLVPADVDHVAASTNHVTVPAPPGPPGPPGPGSDAVSQTGDGSINNNVNDVIPETISSNNPMKETRKPKQEAPHVTEPQNETQWKILKPDYFIPFSCGRRACLGYKMVTSISFSYVANLCLHYQIEPDMESRSKMVHQLEPKGSLSLPLDVDNNCFKLTVKKRTSLDKSV